MKRILTLLTAALIITSSQSFACGGYGAPKIMKWKNVPSAGFAQMTTETFQFYVDRKGKEVRHGFSFQYDGDGNLIGRAIYMDGMVWSGSVARVFMSCGVAASRSHFEKGKLVSREQLSPDLRPAGEAFGAFKFRVAPEHVLDPSKLSEHLAVR